MKDPYLHRNLTVEVRSHEGEDGYSITVLWDRKEVAQLQISAYQDSPETHARFFATRLTSLGVYPKKGVKVQVLPL
jgi:hypothetical protein